MLQLETLILEFLAVDGLATCAVECSKITTLDHELLNHTMKDGS
jgi:hypothetical protein